jgi:DUF1680 family protein
VGIIGIQERKKQEAAMNACARLVAVCATLVILGPAWAAEAPKDYPIQPVPFSAVTVSGGFWGPRLETNRTVTVPYAFKQCEETGRISNFAKAAGLEQGKFEGAFFNDSDVYKVIEGAAYCLKLRPDANLEKYVDGVIDKIAAAQWDDGYLYTFYSVPRHLPGKRWANIAKYHELYCAGHLMEAAVAYHEATGKRKLLDVAIRLADYIDSVFGPGKRCDPPGHEEVEIGLVRLYRATGERRYLALAKFFLDQRGRAEGHKLSGPYGQDHKPVVEQSEAVGHAVRAGYLYSAMADIAALTGDEAYRRAIDRLWENVVGRKLYITGSVGARHEGEAFGADYELPNASAYNETCAAVANALWNHRLFLLEGDAKYLDVLERVIYNGFLSGVSLEGDRFFYPNPLAADRRGCERQAWFGCACCPTNVVRFVPSVPGYAYAHTADAVYVNLFIGGSATVPLGASAVVLRQETNYPWDGEVRITVEPETTAEFVINVRIPGWARNGPVPSDLYAFLGRSDAAVTLRVNSEPVALEVEKGFASLRRRWQRGDVINLSLPMPVRRVVAHEAVKDDAGRVALQRGPVVYCAEGIDNGGSLDALLVPDGARFKARFRKDLLGGVAVVTGGAESLARNVKGSVRRTPVELTAIPYYAWAHRGPCEMAVWLARAESKVALSGPPTPALPSRE